MSLLMLFVLFLCCHSSLSEEKQLRKYVDLHKQLFCVQLLELHHRREALKSEKELQKIDEERVTAWAKLAVDSHIQEEIYTQQHPVNCFNANLFVMPYQNPGNCGHGCQIHYISLGLTYSFITDRTLVLDSNSFWFLQGSKEGEDFFRDYLQPLSSCTTKHYRESEVVRLQDAQQHSSSRVISIKSFWDKLQPFYNKKVPKEYSKGREEDEIDDDLLWWRSQLVYYILRPLPRTWRLIDSARRELCLDRFRPVVGVHLRQGSSVKSFGDYGRRKVFSIDDHIKAADRLLVDHATHILLSTEYPEDVKALSEKYVDRLFLHFSPEGMVPDAHSFVIDHKLKSTASKPYTDLHLIAIINLFTLIESDGLVVQFQSNYSRLLLELLVAIGRDIPIEKLGDFEWMVDP